MPSPFDQYQYLLYHKDPNNIFVFCVGIVSADPKHELICSIIHPPPVVWCSVDLVLSGTRLRFGLEPTSEEEGGRALVHTAITEVMGGNKSNTKFQQK